MAKDGTARGGYQVGGGRPPKNKNVESEAFIGIADLATPGVLEAVDCPPIKDYMKDCNSSYNTKTFLVSENDLIDADCEECINK